MKLALKLTIIVLTLNMPVSRAQASAPTELGDAQMSFDLRLFSEILKQESPNDNLLFSPISASLALSILLNGTAGESRTAMLNAMGVPDYTVQSINQANMDRIVTLVERARQYRESAGPGGGDPLNIEIANSLWVAHGIQLKAPFVDVANRFYNATVRGLDFLDPTSATVINKWASNSTHGKIEYVINAETLRFMSMLLANATYFKASWADKFDERATRKDRFYPTHEDAFMAPTMKKTASMLYASGEDFQAVSLPYVGHTATMTIILPRFGMDVRKFIGNHASHREFWNSVDRSFGEYRVALELPRFKFRNDLSLNQPLVNLGMAQLFTAHANLSLISDAPQAVSYVKQQTFVQLDENGTEAAAVTTIGFVRTSLPPPLEEVRMDVNRPFLVAIRDTFDGSLLFIGVIEKPEW